MLPSGILICCAVPSEAVPFVYLASVCWSLQCLISALTQAGGGGLLFGLLVPSRCGEGLALFSPLRCSGSRLFYMERALRCPRFQPWVFHKSAEQKAEPAFRAFPRPSGSGSQELDGHTLPGSGAPSPLWVPSPSPRPHWSGVCAVCLAVTLPVDVDHPESQEVFD